ncbi:MAG TPA: transcriptional repressor [Sedimenticola thiotaurini]|uniref:Ferric uptake regulation protein n=1 Tax=Sedimenticola thiotaurini TaxID=1543721 RepID=A0A831W6U8_9GAMM|nr:transcriptional repressor [Sedimenticola thiotaurini]
MKTIDEHLDDPAAVSRLLRRHGITPTRQRVVIARAILSRPQHLTADQVLQLTLEAGDRVSKATIYNTLGLFSRKGLIRELTIDSQRAFYDSSTHPHHHFYDPETQQLTDVDEDALQLRLPETLPDGTEIDHVDVVIHLRPSRSSTG